ncbi:MAG TPA: DUF6132 family protein [Anaerovoracaceae bacterium]|nr:DUF6132 family protein [Anaerovoracaceae bacterium]
MIKRIIIGGILGGFAGYLYYYFIGCYSGTCAITSSTVNSALYGIILGGLIIEILSDIKVSAFKRFRGN